MKKLPNEVVMRELVKQWIFEGCKIGMDLDEQGQGVLHIVDSLGFDWAIAVFVYFSTDSWMFEMSIEFCFKCIVLNVLFT
ncbi:hypothetical protein MKX03_016567 [Papaver bracteatum]|nr:hypothetical protein MKX03_016567 [Papaver bracteatum]